MFGLSVFILFSKTAYNLPQKSKKYLDQDNQLYTCDKLQKILMCLNVVNMATITTMTKTTEYPDNNYVSDMLQVLNAYILYPFLNIP